MRLYFLNDIHLSDDKSLYDEVFALLDPSLVPVSREKMPDCIVGLFTIPAGTTEDRWVVRYKWTDKRNGVVRTDTGFQASPRSQLLQGVFNAVPRSKVEGIVGPQTTPGRL
jgi:hypothetical protein